MRISDLSSDVCSSDLILGDENADLLALVLLQHRPDIDIVLQGDRSAFAGGPRHIVEIAIAARGGLPSDIGGIIDEREEIGQASRRASACQYVEISVGGVSLKD